jgi:cell division protein FtsN
MRNVAAILTICLMFFLGTVACSKEEPPPPPAKKPQKIKIVKPVEVQEPEKQKAAIPGDQEKGGIAAEAAEEGKVAAAEQIPERETGEVKSAGVEGKPVTGQEKASKEEGAAEKEAEGVKPVLAEEIAKKQAKELKPDGVEERISQTQESAAGKMETTEKKTVIYYIVKKGESLYDVASREDVYANKLKWPILYRYNSETLSGLKTDEDVVVRALPEGLKLRVIGHDDVEENLDKRQKMRWVVNVISISKNKEIVPITIALIKDGYLAYLTQATIKGKVWTRLRVGFFSGRAEADAEKEKIKDLLHLDDPWSIELGKEEFEEFAGY